MYRLLMCEQSSMLASMTDPVKHAPAPLMGGGVVLWHLVQKTQPPMSTYACSKQGKLS